jgi:transcriptional regulator with XRE-family HTH domain
MNEREKFGHRFKKTLEYANWNSLKNDELGKIFNVSATSISHWKNGKKIPSVEHMVEIANKCDVSVVWLAQGYGKPNLLEAEHETSQPRVNEPMVPYVHENSMQGKLLAALVELDEKIKNSLLSALDTLTIGGHIRPDEQEIIMNSLIDHLHTSGLVTGRSDNTKLRAAIQTS